ncbi:LysR family transcriptional regulator [Nocardia shimofusensis]|uniref:LysR family transcriptional regulator n=1 Tax=Nocardia shimofusensis TaxID=228596 RepID=UPI00083706AC|nr:LysR family transcriptional regulator [Nocardia shimofusensis]
MDLIRHLRFFVSVADEGHFGRAAAALDMTQPPLSQGLRRLEQFLGVELVHRTRQGAMLTAGGRQLLPRSRLLVDDADRLLAEAQRIAHARGDVHLGVVAAIPDPLITACVSALRHSAGATVSTTVGSTVELLGDLRAGLCDVAVVEHPALVDGVEAGPVVKVARRVIVPSDHRSATAERPTLRMLAGLTFAHPPRAANPPAFDTVLDLLRERGLDPQVASARDDRAVLAAVAAGTSFGLTTTVPSNAPGITWLDLAPQAFALRVRVAWRPDARSQAGARSDTDARSHAAALDRVLYRERLR